MRVDGRPPTIGIHLIAHAFAPPRPPARHAGKKLASVRELYTEHGDLGTVADLSRATQRTLFPPPPLTVQGCAAHACACVSGVRRSVLCDSSHVRRAGFTRSFGRSRALLAANPRTAR